MQSTVLFLTPKHVVKTCGEVSNLLVRKLLILLNFYAEKLLGGGAGIRTLDASFSSHTPLAGEPLQPLGHASKPSANFSMRQA